MDGVDIIHVKEWHLFRSFNITHPFFTLNAHTLIFSWIALAVLLALGIFIKFILPHKRSTIRFLILASMRSFSSMISQTIGRFSYPHITFITALFLYIFFCNIVAIIPFVEEATKDINTTFAFGIISFLYVQSYAIGNHGVVGYLKEFTTPFFLMAPLHIISKLSTVVSMSFRLFGNIFGSGIILRIYTIVQEKSILFQILSLITGFNIIVAGFFILFEGFLQAFVFTMLTLTYLGIALSPEEANETEHPHA